MKSYQKPEIRYIDWVFSLIRNQGTPAESVSPSNPSFPVGVEGGNCIGTGEFCSSADEITIQIQWQDLDGECPTDVGGYKVGIEITKSWDYTADDSDVVFPYVLSNANSGCTISCNGFTYTLDCVDEQLSGDPCRWSDERLDVTFIEDPDGNQTPTSLFCNEDS